MIDVLFIIEMSHMQFCCYLKLVCSLIQNCTVDYTDFVSIKFRVIQDCPSKMDGPDLPGPPMESVQFERS